MLLFWSLFLNKVIQLCLKIVLLNMNKKKTGKVREQYKIYINLYHKIMLHLREREREKERERERERERNREREK